MENRRPRNQNPSSSGSFSLSQRHRGQKLPSNATQNPKPRTFSRTGTPSTASSSNSGIDPSPGLNSRKLDRDEDVDVERPTYSGSLVGTCPHMCPSYIAIVVACVVNNIRMIAGIAAKKYGCGRRHNSNIVAASHDADRNLKP